MSEISAVLTASPLRLTKRARVATAVAVGGVSLVALPVTFGLFGESAFDLLAVAIAVVAGLFGSRAGMLSVAAAMAGALLIPAQGDPWSDLVDLAVFVAVAQATGRLHDLLVESHRHALHLGRSDAILRSVLENAPLVIWAVDANGRYTLREGRALRALGQGPGHDLGRDAREFYRTEYPEAYAELTDNLERAFAGEEFHTVVRLRGRAMDVGYRPVKDAHGRITGVVCAGADVTEREAMESQLRDSKARFEGIVTSSADALITVDPQGHIVLFNPAAETMFGRAAHEMLGHTIDELIPRSMRTSHRSHVARYLDNTGRGQPMHKARALKALRSNGEMFDVEATLTRTNVDGEVLATVTIRDVTDKRRTDAQLEHLALHDQLTDLPNRTLFRDRLTQAIARMDPHGEPFSLMILDLDNFREANDSLGQQTGDDILREVAQRLRWLARDADTVARLGGDDFGVLLGGMNAEGAREIAQRFVEVMRRPFAVGDKRVVIGASVGIAVAPEHGSDAATLMRRADVAMYQAKRDRDRYVLYSAQVDEPGTDQITLAAELRSAVDRGDIGLAYQPEVRVSDRSLIRFEALARWDRGSETISPEDFVPLAERMGLISALTRCVLDRALCQVGEWQRAGIESAVAVNISGHDVADDGLPGLVRALLDRHHVPAGKLTLEITESALVRDIDRVLPRLNALRDLGVTLAIDDFGSGYSSLAYLSRLPVAEMKIDRTFVHRMTIDDNALVIVRAAISLGHDLGLRVTAEGVENDAESQLLRALHCDAAQGFGIDRPLTADGARERLSRSVLPAPAATLSPA